MDNNDFYKNFESSSHKKGVWEKFFLPFIAGALGCTVVLGGFYAINKSTSTQTSTSSSSVLTTNSNASNGLIETVSLSNYSDTASYAASKVLPSIVSITVEYNVSSTMMFYGQMQSTATAEGSGIIISEDGYILTNNHIINSTDSSSYYQVSQATSVKVCLYGDETAYDAKIIGTDSQTDLAIIKIDKEGLTAAEIGDSSSLKIGEFVLAIGNPLGVGTSVSSGIVSALDREITEDNVTYHLIQTDAAINSGNSGGALVNSQGQVVGINTLKASGDDVEGMGFAIPINDTIDIYKQLITNGKVLRPYIGIAGMDINEATAEKNNLPVGIYVKSIETFSAAEKAGLKIGDVITSIDGTEVKTMDELNNIKNQKNIGDTITLGIYRDGKNTEISLTLGEQP